MLFKKFGCLEYLSVELIELCFASYEVCTRIGMEFSLQDAWFTLPPCSIDWNRTLG